ncbi:BACON domain-containing protein [Bacteroides fragilis]|uniref:BACON domain-containing protein n=1 Tax=Bacteroides fragilis TaxID=817 RepID=A0A9Q4IUY8_BACFG|nr:BACON domain-containing carbohydrate-binding protein [Bacteroides fragilis]MCZ2516699.1 BACON domain-containing protein [Bacteroides fragilis]MCZ2573337.1 BACON domain-containing protein [Bacteroides fragilis]MCZ2684957.1 BACON domain-containing protein [Bacteroides fragilis]UVO61402.1 BACON domain-containing protein [Bacteroides fragilis]UVS39675.1 BACON domain-containing protein [Bacteroides fragilis]
MHSRSVYRMQNVRQSLRSGNKMILGEKNALHLECKVFLSAQKKMDEKRTMTGKRIYTGLMGLLLFLAFACTDDRESPGGTNGNPSLVFRMTRASADIINNTQVYLFDGDGATAGQFRQKVPDVTYAADRLTMPVAAGTWDITLVSADGDVNSGLIQPVRGQARSSLKMWETRSVGGSLPSMPELRTAYITGQQVIAGQDNVASETALLSRNVALVKVVIADAGGLDINGTHTMKLTNVPTTLNWEGGLYPNKNNPTVSAEPMTGTFTIHNNTAMAGHQYSDTLRFIVPAHKGTDYLNALPTDTTTSHLKLSVDLASEGGTRFEKTDVVIPRVPRVNGILLVRIFLGGKLDVSTEILNWQDTQLEADLSQTQLYTDKASVGLAFKDTIHVNTNAREYTVEKAPEATWITSVKKLDGNAVEITADLDSYVDNHPRTSYITIKANNVTKKIPVTQRPDRGTIKVSEHKLIFCPKVHEKRSVEVKSIGGDWIFLGSSPKATSDIQNGVKGNTTVNFTRTSTIKPDDFDTCYGDGQIVVKNKTTLDTDTISLVNCYIHMDDGVINAVAPTGTAQTAVTNSQDVTVFGGSRNILFDSWESWIHNDLSWNPSTQVLTMTTDREPSDEARDGSLIFHHADCSDYQVTAKVHQDVIVTIPAFDFFVVKFTWVNNDVDIAVEFSGNDVSGNGNNNSSYDKYPVGWSFTNSVWYNNQELLRWGGDATGGQGETAFFNAPVLEGDVNSPRKIKLDVYATWFTPGRAPDKMTFTMSAYKGGTMVQNGTNFDNQGGETLYQQGHTVMITTTKGKETYATGGYTKVATITYDRIKHSATVNVWASSASTRSSRSVRVPFRPEEKPLWAPVVVNTYSDNYQGERR